MHDLLKRDCLVGLGSFCASQDVNDDGETVPDNPHSWFASVLDTGA